MQVKGLASIDVHTSNGEEFESYETWANGQGGFWNEQRWMAGDFNGDGYDDLANVFGDMGLASIDVHVSTEVEGEDGEYTFELERWATQQGGYWAEQKWMVGDFNGDGYDDLANVYDNGMGMAAIDVHLSNGEGEFDKQTWATEQGGFWNEQKWLVGDINADGKDDLINVFGDGSGLANVDVHYATYDFGEEEGSFALDRWATGQGGFWDQQKWLAGGFNDAYGNELVNIFDSNGMAAIDVHTIA